MLNPSSIESVRYSLVIPLYNERENILPLYEALKETMDADEGRYECIFVDDGSSDGSAQLLRELAAVDSRIVVLRMKRNSGKSMALSSGFSAAQGEFILTMDGDLQHDPADIPRFVEKLEEGFDIVCGWRERRDEPSLMQRISTRISNTVLARLTGVKIHDFGGGFKAYRRELVSDLPLYGELQRLIPALAMEEARSVCEVPIVVRPRKHGESKYGIGSKLPVALDLLTVRFLVRYLTRPLHFFGTAGILSLSAGTITGLVLLFLRIAHDTLIMQEHGPLMIFAVLLIMMGVQLLALGLLAEMQVRHYYDSHGRSAAHVVICDSRTENAETRPE